MGAKRFALEEAVGPELFQDLLGKAKNVIDHCLQRNMKPILLDPDDLHIPPMVFHCFLYVCVCGHGADTMRTNADKYGHNADKCGQMRTKCGQMRTKCGHSADTSEICG